MLIEELKKRMFAAMKRKDVVEKEVLRTVIGDVTSTGADPDDQRVESVIRKMVKSNEETLAVAETQEARDQLEREIAVLREFLPGTLSVEQIGEHIASVADAVRAASSEGQAMGVAMKHLKAAGASVDGKDVALAVKRLRTG